MTEGLNSSLDIQCRDCKLAIQVLVVVHRSVWLAYWCSFLVLFFKLDNFEKINAQLIIQIIAFYPDSTICIHDQSCFIDAPISSPSYYYFEANPRCVILS